MRLAIPIASLGMLACASETPAPVGFHYALTSETAPATEVPPPPAEISIDDLSLEAAVWLALDTDPELAAQRLQPVVDGAFEAIERGVFDPRLFAEGSYFRERAVQTARATGERFDVTGEQTSEALGLRQTLPTGTELELAVRHRLDDSDRTPSQNEARLDVSITQSLLRGFGLDVNLAALRQAEARYEASHHELGAFAAALVADVEATYWRLTGARVRLKVLERGVESATQERDLQRSRVQAGLLPPLDLAAIEAELATRRQALVEAEAEVASAGLELLRRLDRSGELTGVPLPSAMLPDTPGRPEKVEDRVALALIRRPELAQAQAQLRAGNLQVEVTRNGLLPRLDVFASFGKTGFDDSASGAFGNLGEQTFDARVGLSLDYALGHRAASASDRAARATAEQARRAVDNLERQVRLEVRLASVELRRAAGQLGASRATLEARDAALEAARAHVEAGTGTTLELAQAQSARLSAEVAMVDARVAYAQARLRLYLADGSLLARRGIQIADR